MTEEKYIYSDHKSMIADLRIANQPLLDQITKIQSVYLSDGRPWIIGFSGGKDSTCILSLIYSAILSLENDQRSKPIYVVSSDTLVETPLVIDLLNQTHELIKRKAEHDNLPITVHKVFPQTEQTFWTNLLGRGYPAPTQSFRWCTERLKIDPVSQFITAKANEFGEVIVALGSRTQESASRAQSIAKHKNENSNLGRHTTLPNAFTYMPIVDWSADDVWQYLMSAPCPWGGDNQLLFDLYKGSNQGECPIVIDKSTPSCGNSRFGCWTCTVVSEDKALHGLIESGEDWMKPLLDYRNMLHNTTNPDNKEEYRNYKRRTGKVHYWSAKEDTNKKNKNGEVIRERKKVKASESDNKVSLGPYWMKYRQKWLRELLQLEKELRDLGHNNTLITKDELQIIRREWLRDPNEPDWADSLPRIYNEVYQDDKIDWFQNDTGAFSRVDAALLNELGKKYEVPAELIMKLIEVELSISGLGKRKGIFDKLEKVFSKDWESLKEINQRNFESNRHSLWKEKIEELRSKYSEIQSG